MRRASVLGILLLVSLAGCEEEGPPPSLLADLGALHVIVDRDPAVEPLEIVERVIDEERPVHAAQVLRTSAIPAAEEQIEIVRSVRLTTSEGNAFGRRLVTAYRSRVSALETYRDVLEGGAGVDPMNLLDAIQGVRQAEEALLEVTESMTEVAPPAPMPLPEEGAAPGDEVAPGEAEEGSN